MRSPARTLVVLACAARVADGWTCAESWTAVVPASRASAPLLGAWVASFRRATGSSPWCWRLEVLAADAPTLAAARGAVDERRRERARLAPARAAVGLLRWALADPAAAGAFYSAPDAFWLRDPAPFLACGATAATKQAAATGAAAKRGGKARDAATERRWSGVVALRRSAAADAFLGRWAAGLANATAGAALPGAAGPPGLPAAAGCAFDAAVVAAPGAVGRAAAKKGRKRCGGGGVKAADALKCGAPAAALRCGGVAVVGGDGVRAANATLGDLRAAELLAAPPRPRSWKAAGRRIAVACTARPRLIGAGGVWASRCVLLKHYLEAQSSAFDVTLASFDDVRAAGARYDVGIAVKAAPPPAVAALFDHVLVDVVDADAFAGGGVDRHDVRDFPRGASVVVQNPAHARAWCGARALGRSGGRAFVVEHLAPLMNATSLPAAAEPAGDLRVLTIHEKSRFSKDLCAMAGDVPGVAYDCEERVHERANGSRAGDQGRTRERNSQLQSLVSRPFSTRFG